MLVLGEPVRCSWLCLYLSVGITLCNLIRRVRLNGSGMSFIAVAVLWLSTGRVVDGDVRN